MENRTIALRLTDYARDLEASKGNLYRVRAYRRAATLVETLDRPVAEIVAEAGRAGLKSMPGIGPHLSYTIAELVRTGEFRTMPVRSKCVSRS